MKQSILNVIVRWSKFPAVRLNIILFSIIIGIQYYQVYRLRDYSIVMKTKLDSLERRTVLLDQQLERISLSFQLDEDIEVLSKINGEINSRQKLDSINNLLHSPVTADSSLQISESLTKILYNVFGDSVEFYLKALTNPNANRQKFDSIDTIYKNREENIEELKSFNIISFNSEALDTFEYYKPDVTLEDVISYNDILPETKPGVYVILGGFKYPTDAIYNVAKIKKLGFSQTSLIYLDGTIGIVIISRHEKIRPARKAMKSLQNRFEIPASILIVE